MSSTRTRPDATAALEHAVPIEPIDAPGTDEAEFAGFVRAAGKGIAIGLPIIMVIIAVTVKWADPSIDAAGLAAIVAWVGVWTGVFLGGTITVGLWAARQH